MSEQDEDRVTSIVQEILAATTAWLSVPLGDTTEQRARERMHVYATARAAGLVASSDEPSSDAELTVLVAGRMQANLMRLFAEDSAAELWRGICEHMSPEGTA